MITPQIKRKKVNFMLDQHIIVEMQHWIPAGDRSDFVNQSLEESILQYKRKRASEAMDELRKKANIRITTEEMIRLKNYGRK